MTQEKLLVRLSGTAAEILNQLVKRGYFSTKSEAVRAGILRLGENFGMIKPATQYWQELAAEIQRTGRRLKRSELLEAVRKLEQKT